MSRSFDGTDDNLVFPVSAAGNVGFGTLAAIIKTPASWSGTRSVMRLLTGAFAGCLGMFVASGGQVGMSNGVAAPIGSTVLAANEWYLIAVGKATGTATPRVHIYRYSTGVWVHENTAGGVANAALPSTSGFNTHGQRVGDHFLQATVSVIGLYATALSDGDVETMELSLTAWSALSPVGLWAYNQAATTDAVQDLSGNAAHQSAITGTAVSADEPDGWSYGGAAEAVAGTTAGVATASGTLTATVPVAGGVAGTGATTGAASATVPVSGASAGVGAVAGAASATVPVAGSAAGSGTAAAAVTLAAGVAGSSAGTSTASGALAATAPLAGSIGAVASVAGALSSTVPVSGATAGTSSASGTVDVPGQVTADGTSAGTSTASGQLSATVPIAGAVSGLGATSGALAAAVAILAASAGASEATGQLARARGVVGQAAGVGLLAGILAATVPISGSAAGVAVLIGLLSGGEDVLAAIRAAASDAAHGQAVASDAAYLAAGAGDLALVGALASDSEG